jgi:hypothetical protein
MSYIDSFKHKIIKTIEEDIRFLVLYQALEDIDGDEFKLESGQYVLGGGGGEYPAIIIKDIKRCKQLINFRNDNGSIVYNEDNSITSCFDLLDFVDFTISDYVILNEIAIKNGFNKTLHENIECWLISTVVEILKDYK